MPADHISPLMASGHPEAVQHFFVRLRQEQPAAYERLRAMPMGWPLLATVFSHSRFLSEELLQHPEWLEGLIADGSLDRPFTVQDFQQALCPLLDQDAAPPALTLAQFRRRQLLRIFLRDTLGRAELAEVCEEISHLADAILEATLERIQAGFTKRYGVPQYELPDGSAAAECRLCVLALGKLGGMELNYSSDIDLMFLFTANGQTDGPESITNKEFFKKVANSYTQLLSTYTAEGLCYRVDLRLRPDGQRGELCQSLDGAERYYAQRARDWELQMLIKARVAAGDRELGAALLASVEPRIYATTLNFTAIEAMSETRERINEKLGRKRKASAALDIKLAPGGIRDIEFLVQCLQRLHGGREPWVRHGGTLLALSRLRDKELLSPTEYARLADAYCFLRTLEHRLQIDEDRQTHTLPTRPEELEILARRMPAAQVGNEVSADALTRELQHHLVTVQEIYERVIHAQSPWRRELAEQEALPRNIVRHLDQKAPELATALSQSGLKRGRRVFEQLLERLGPYPELLAQLDSDTPLARDVFDIFEYSPYLAEEFVRAPELLGQILRARHQLPPSPPYQEWPEKITDPVELRRLYKREMVRIQAESICCTQSVFGTLGSTSDLADATLAVAYRMAVEQVVATRGPAHPGYLPGDQMLLIALGRLGMREFDLASDADLLFVLPDPDVGELEFWTRVAERVISLLSSYTKEGRIFSIDTRLRPNGRRGPLLQTETSCKKYFATQAEAWEGIAYMKARAVAGNTNRATDFLNELQELDWRRYGQSGRSRQDLRVMRARLEREQGDELALKTGYGGYYDIDFSLMYLRLRGGGLFFKVLSTPERIDIVEKMGHLGRTDAEFLRQAATFYRAIDHGLRLYSGHAEGMLPSSAAALESLTELVTRWTGPCPEGLAERLRYVQHATRYLFERLFADETPWSDLP